MGGYHLNAPLLQCSVSDDFFTSNTWFHVLVADIRCSNSGDTIRRLGDLLSSGGLLILGSVDDVDEDSDSGKHSGAVLSRYFDRVPCLNNEAAYPHIYKETRNKHQFAISHFSVWRKKPGILTLRAASAVEDEFKDAVEYYENDKILSSYDMFHFGEGLLSVKNFPLRMAEVIIIIIIIIIGQAYISVKDLMLNNKIQFHQPPTHF